MKRSLMILMVLLASVSSVYALDMSLKNPFWQAVGKTILLVAVGAFFVMASTAKSTPKSAAKGLGFAGMAIVAIGVLNLVLGAAGMSFLGLGVTAPVLGAGIITTLPAAAIAAGCDATVSPAPIWTMNDEYAGGAALTEATNLYRIIMDPAGKETIGAWTTFTSGTAIGAVDAFTTIEIIFGISTTDETGNAYGPHVSEWQVPCSENPRDYFNGANDENPTGLSSTFLNRIGSAAAETIAAGVNTYVHVDYVTGNNEVYGNKYADIKYPNIFVLEQNNTVWDLTTDVVATIVNAPPECDCLVELERTSPPVAHVTESGNTTVAWKFPAMYDGMTLRVKVNLDPDDTTASANDDAWFYLYSGNFYINSISNELMFGVEDESQNLVGQSVPEITTGDFT